MISLLPAFACGCACLYLQPFSSLSESSFEIIFEASCISKLSLFSQFESASEIIYEALNIFGIFRLFNNMIKIEEEKLFTFDFRQSTHI